MEKGEAKKGKVMTNRELQQALLENFVNLQRVLTNLSVKFDVLSDNITRLLQLFEISAKSFIKKQEENGGKGEEKFMLEKLDTLLDQNKTIARGLTLMEEKVRHKIYGDHMDQMKPSITNRNQPTFQNPNRFEETKPEEEKTKPRPLPRI